MGQCSCGKLTLGNTGIPGCVEIAKETANAIFVLYIKGDGSINNIPIPSTIDADFWDAHTQRYDSNGDLVSPYDRYYFLGKVENPEDLRDDPVYQTYNSGNVSLVREGKRHVNWMIADAPAEMLQFLEENKCHKIGVFLIDQTGNIIGNHSVEDELRPLRIDMASYYAGLVKANGGNTTQSISLRFNFADTEFDADLGMIYAKSLEVPTGDVEPLISIYGDIVGSVTTTSFTMQLKSKYGDVMATFVPKGLLAADFELEETAPTPGSIAIVSCTESATIDGRYTFTYATQTSADKLKLTLKKKGYDGETIEDIVITIP